MGIILLGCEKALEPESPDFLLSNEAVFNDAATVNAALANVYAGLRDNSPVMGSSGGLNVLLGLYTDELNYYRSDSENDNAFYHHNVLPQNSAVASLWDQSYALIYAINAILEGLENSQLPTAEKEDFMGEVLFLRAYVHFFLSQLYGDIPYIKTTDYRVTATVSRMPMEMVYDEIEEDLITARGLLPEMDASGERVRVTKGASSAFLARLYLYTGQWERAYAESNEVINNGNYTWQPDLNMVFLKDSPSTIWQLQPEFEGGATIEGQTFIFEFGPPSLYALTDKFILDFEEGDLRKEFYTREISDGTKSWFHPFKYKQNMFEGSSTEYSIQLRLAEQYLIRAESSFQLGNFIQAKNDIDLIRLRAGLAPTVATTSEEIKNEIMHQRKYELFTEQGHRWFDLRRMGIADEILSPIKTGWKPTDILFPLPLKELLLNSNLYPQNPGY